MPPRWERFNSQITLTCSAPAGLTCSLSPSTISPGSSAASSTLTISAASTPPPTGYNLPGMLALMPGLGLFGTLITTRKSKLLTPEEHSGGEPTGLGACYLTVRPWMRWQQLQQTHNSRIWSGHCNGNRDLRLSESFQRGNSHYQLRQKPRRGRTSVLPRPWASLDHVRLTAKKHREMRKTKSGGTNGVRTYRVDGNTGYSVLFCLRQ